MASQEQENNHIGIKDSLKRSKVLTTQDEIYGIPSKVFFAGVGISIAFSVSVYWLFGPLFALLYFPAMYSIHQDDPHALKVWMGNLKNRHHYWSAGRYQSVNLHIIDNSFTKTHREN